MTEKENAEKEPIIRAEREEFSKKEKRKKRNDENINDS